MSSKWKKLTVEEIASSLPAALSTGPFGSSIGSKHFTSFGVPVIRGSNLSSEISTRLNDEGLVFVSSEKAKEFQRSIARKDDLVFTCWGTINQVGYIDDSSKYPEYIVSNKQMKLTLDKQKAHPLYIYYVFSGPKKQREILDNGIGSSVPGFNLGQLKKHEIFLPPLSEQKSIAALLGNLDDRITLLRETNNTLEAIAQALFKSWFVDFDPVHAKQQGRAPEGMDAQTAALFPDSLEESELGMVPKGWTPVRLDNFVELAYGKALKAEARIAGDIPVYGSGGITGWHNAALVNEPSIVVGRKGTVGSLYWESRPFFPIDTVFYVKTKKPLSYVFQVLKILGLNEMNTDAAVPGLNRENAYRLLVAGAPENIINAFETIASSFRNSVVHNLRQIDALKETRDTLLPRLISGQLRLPEAQALVADAVEA